MTMSRSGKKRGESVQRRPELSDEHGSRQSGLSTNTVDRKHGQLSPGTGQSGQSSDIVNTRKTQQQPDKDGAGIAQPQLDKDGAGIAEPQLDKDETGIAQPQLDKDETGIAQPQLDKDGTGIAEPQLDKDETGIAQPQLDKDETGIAQPQLDKDETGIAQPQLDKDETGKAQKLPDKDGTGIAQQHHKDGTGKARKQLDKTKKEPDPNHLVSESGTDIANVVGNAHQAQKRSGGGETGNSTTGNKEDIKPDEPPSYPDADDFNDDIDDDDQYRHRDVDKTPQDRTDLVRSRHPVNQQDRIDKHIRTRTTDEEPVINEETDQKRPLKQKVAKGDISQNNKFQEEQLLFLKCVCVVCVVIIALLVYQHNEIQNLKSDLKKLEKLGETLKPSDSVYSGKLKTITETIKGLEDHHKTLNGKLDSLKESAESQISQLTGKIEADIRTKFQSHQHESRSAINDLNNEVKERESQLKIHMENLQDKVEKDVKPKLEEIDTLNERVGDLKDTLEKGDKIVQELTERQSQFEKKVDASGQKLQSKIDNFDKQQQEITEKSAKLNESLTTAEEQLKKFDEKMKNVNTGLTTVIDNIFDKKVALVVIALVLFTNCVLVFAVFILCQGHSKTGTAGQQTAGQITNANQILNEIPYQPPLRRAVGVVSFSEHYQSLHRKLAASIKGSLTEDVEFVYYVINIKEDIIKIPRCTVVIICIEYTDRDVIIEESGLGLGDYNKTTLKAVEKLGAVPVIIYDKDPRSRRLQPDKLFSSRIDCATQQVELIPLSSQNRFFSVFDTLSDFQKTTFKTMIENHVLSNSS